MLQLRFCVYCITYVLISIQRRVLALPAYCIGLRVLNYLRGNRKSEGVHLFSWYPH